MSKDPVELLQYDLQTLFRKTVRNCRAFFNWHAAAGVIHDDAASVISNMPPRTRRGLAMNVVVSVMSRLLSTRLCIGGDLEICRRKLRDVGSTVVQMLLADVMDIHASYDIVHVIGQALE